MKISSFVYVCVTNAKEYTFRHAEFYRTVVENGVKPVFDMFAPEFYFRISITVTQLIVAVRMQVERQRRDEIDSTPFHIETIIVLTYDTFSKRFVNWALPV